MPGRQRSGSRVALCCVCRQPIEKGHRPWSEVTLTGYTVAWHTFCDAAKREKEAKRARPVQSRVPVLPAVAAVPPDADRDGGRPRETDATSRSEKPRKGTRRRVYPLICTVCGTTDESLFGEGRVCRPCVNARVKEKQRRRRERMGEEAYLAMGRERQARSRARKRAS